MRRKRTHTVMKFEFEWLTSLVLFKVFAVSLSFIEPFFIVTKRNIV